MFADKPETYDRADWPLLQNGPINLYLSKEIFETDIGELEALDYRILRVKFTTFDEFKLVISDLLEWKKQFGYSRWNGNLNALNDGFRGLDDEPRPVVICVEDFEKYVSHDTEHARHFLDIITRASRANLLFGQAVLCLVQTSDNQYETGELGGISAQWNRREWLHSDRGL